MNVGTQVLEATVSALSRAMPDKSIAGWGRRRGHYIAGLDPRTGERYVQTTTDADGGAGAVWGYDGYEGALGMSGLGSINRGSVEEIEIRFPWRTVKWQFVPDLSGAGRWRGGCGMLWEVENLGGDVGAATGSSDGDLTRPPGAAGGEDGPLSRMYIRRGDTVTPARTHRMVQIRTGEILGKVSGGGGGVGDPLLRDPAAVLEDVIDEMTTIAYARDVHGVAVVDGVPPTLDVEETGRLRSRAIAARSAAPAGIGTSDIDGDPTLATPLAMLERMWLIRAFEERASELYAKGRIPGLLHLGIGQEGSAVGLSAALAPGDRVFGGHRSHAHALARGADPTRLLAELLGRVTGYCGGKGGSMHIAAPEVGFVTATGVVAGNIPLALGAGLASMDGGDGSVAVAVFGDGAGQAGGFHESLNLASLWGLPVVFVCENNGYAEFSPLSAHTRVERLARHAETYRIPAVTVDGNDASAVRDAAGDAVARARTGAGPSFVEALTYRLRGHYEGDPGRYRELSELAEWRSKDPILRFAASAGLEDGSAGAEASARAVVDAATEAALAAPVPDLRDLMTHVTAVLA